MPKNLWEVPNRLSDVELTEVEKDKFTGAITFSVEVSFQRNKKNEN